MSVNIESTTDTKAQVNAAIGNAKPVESEVENKSEADSKEPVETPEASDVQDEEAIESEDKGEAEDADAEESKDESKEPKKTSGLDKRFSKLTKQKAELAAKALAAETEREYWKAEALKAKAPEPKAEATIKPTDGEPDPANYETQVEYAKALTKYVLAEDRKAEAQKAKETQVKSEVEKRAADYSEKAKAFAASTDDFNELMDEMNDVPMTHALNEALLNAGPELAYALAKNKSELLRINALDYGQALREFGKFEAKHLSTESKNIPTEKLTSKAPAPVRPVGSNSTNASAKAPDNMSYQEYKAWREKTK